MDSPSIVAAMASAAIAGGASAVRIEGIRNVEAVRTVTDRPIIGIVKVDLDSSPVRITPHSQDIRDLISAGADIIAFDATDRTRPEPVEALLHTVQSLGAYSMADCSCLSDGKSAHALGADILASTLSGYTSGSVPATPDLALVRQLATLDKFIIAEGRYNSPESAAAALTAGADAVVVGTAITRTEVVTGWFREAIHR
ncbi:N-acetylmannosamine-6-phosphate 2-epimerase [Chromatiales bacterium (ex Bugula neritina AB1)]|nr:N-acetylmannosamine-6-phosphate 2-epimerase [Chromatiales bacterium (ex Bugula neritina AB1)]